LEQKSLLFHVKASFDPSWVAVANTSFGKEKILYYVVSKLKLQFLTN